MNIFAFDTETYLIRPGRQAPRVVCVQSRAGGVELREAGLDRLEAALHAGDLIVAHSAAYDAACSIATRPRLLAPWFEAYSNDRVTCTKVREKLIRIAQGSARKGTLYDLLTCVGRHDLEHDFEAGDKSGEGWRLRYAELDGIPVDQWPSEAKRYALADLVVEDLHQAQADNYPAEWLADEYRRSRFDFALYLQSCSGMRTDPRAVEAFGRKVEAEHEEHRERLTEGGLVRSDGSRNVARARAHMRSMCADKGITVPITKTGKERESTEDKYTALDADACAATGDPLLARYAKYTTIGTLRRRVERLALAGEIPIQPRFDVLKVTGRTSASKGDVLPGKPLLAYGDSVQNLNRAPGLRECYTARAGYVLASVDWSGAELHSLAQVCLWLGLGSKLAEVLNAGRDAHLHFACTQNSWDYDWAEAALRGEHGSDARKIVKAARQGSKAFNFGFPGGLGIETFRVFARKTYGVELTEDGARAGKAQWMATHPEMQGYFQHINELLESDAPLVHFLSGRFRGALTYCSAANSYFQGHTADMAGHAGWALTREYYGIDPGPLNGARPWNFVHDEFIAEVPEASAHECATRMVEIMEASGKVYCPDVPVKAEPAISRRWRKGAEPEWLDGRLIPWEDRPMPADVRASIQKELDAGADPIQVSWKYGFEEERINEHA